MKRSAIALAVMLFLGIGPALAQNPVEITSDQFVMNETAHEAVFTGNVVVVHPTVTVWAPKVVATYGEGGTTDIETFVASGGNVRLKTEDQDATGQASQHVEAEQFLAAQVFPDEHAKPVEVEHIKNNMQPSFMGKEIRKDGPGPPQEGAWFGRKS